MKRKVGVCALAWLAPLAAAQDGSPATVTTQSRVTTPPPVSSPAAIGKPHVCLQFYPPDAIAAGIQGTATVAFIVTDQGTVKNPRIASSSGNGSLDAAAIDCVREWQYKPALESGNPVPVAWSAEVKWALYGRGAPSAGE